MWLTDPGGRSHQVIESRHARAHDNEDAPASEGSEVSKRELEDRITASSPEGRPEHIEMGGRRLLWLVVAPVGSLLILGAVVYFIWGLAAAGLVFVFGTALAFLGNPEVWATYLRAQERDQIEHPKRHEDDAV